MVLRSLVHYRRTGAVVVVGLAIAAAVIVGSLVIGDSIEGSIRHTALARLGQIHDAVTAPRFFRADLRHDADLRGAAATLIQAEGSARAEGGDAVVAGITVIGADDDLLSLYPDSDTHTPEPRSALINESLATAARVNAGDTLLVTISRPGEAMVDTLFARRERDETLATLRVTVQDILPDLGPGGFRLDPSTAMPRNVIVDREWLAQQIGEPGRANTIVVGAEAGAELHGRINRAVTLDDHGLYLRRHGAWLSVFSDAVVLNEAQVGAIEAATKRGISPTSVYLADTITAADDPSREIAYAVVTDVSSKKLPLRSRQAGPVDGLILNAWAAQDLDAEVGERFAVTWRVSTPSGYEDRSAELTLTGIAEMQGLGAEPDLVPDFEGITDAGHIDEWDPPFPVDLSLVTERDDEYWERYRAAPKAFVSSSLLQRMWQGEDGEGPWITSVRLDGADADEYEQALREELEPEDAGFRFMRVREQALAASKGTSDFGQLFLGMSFFLVLAGTGLAGTLMRLSAERRASQAGIMIATGFVPKQAGRVIAFEGVALSLAGVVIGTPLGIGYAHAIVNVLATRWQGALGDAPVLGVYIEPMSIAIGAAAAAIVGVIATWWGARVLSGRPVLDLLRGWQAAATGPSPGRPWTAIATPVLIVLAAGIFVAAITDAIPAEGAFFGIGGALLLAALTGAHLLLSRAMARAGATRSRGAFALRAAASARGRSLLLMGLIAAATFVIVTVAANSRDFSQLDVHDRSSGTGGFALVATSSVPLRFDPATEEGRENLGFLPEEQEALGGVEVISLARSPGEDISCLNVARPALPRLLGATDALIERGGFTFASTVSDAPGNPWTLLRESTPEGASPA
ncbi:MAG: FtsX-like permease family protein, partial [Armatimonadota bacterium]